MKAVIKVLGVQKNTDRFDKETDAYQYPNIATWRCNLTGLSQRHNLYFVAFVGHIYVYEPQFPSQALPCNPALIIHTPPSRPGLTGSLDPHNPRGINYLVLQDLGLQEILAVARDDGDVEVYLVAQIIHAVERGASGYPAEVRPFFQSNVGRSAWGLAVHSNARVLAASSNAHNVTIFKFGLIGDGREGESNGRQDVTQVMVNGDTNIPAIAFCNTGDDPDCRWLLTTDIVGDTRAIDLHTLHGAQTFTFMPTTPGARHHPLHAGWTVMCLDRRSFTHLQKLQHHFGILKYTSTEQIWDATFSAMDLPHDHHSKVGSSRYGLPRDYKFTYPIKAKDEVEFCGDLPCPTLHASVKNVYLLQPAGGPIILLDDTLQRDLPENRVLLDAFDRLNMHAYIPSIGVVVLASQKGRAIIIGLNRISYKEMPCQDDILYCMSIDAILPLPSQDREQKRPYAPLLGIAVGPIQGTEGLGDERRWRLMMTFYDHTVLSYEIERSGGEDSVTRVVESIVV